MAVVVACLIIWQIVAQAEIVSPLFFPAPLAVAKKIVALVGGGSIWPHLQVTAERLLVGYFAAVVLGIGFGGLFGGLRFPRDVFMPYVVLLFSLPKIAIFPLFLLWFGMGFNLYVAYSAMSGLFPILLNTIAGFREVRQPLVTAARSMGASTFEIYREVVFPTMVPLLFAGLRMGLNFTILGVTISELIMAKQGVGAIINRATFSFNADELYAIIVLVVIMVTLLNEGLRAIESRMSRWSEA